MINGRVIELCIEMCATDPDWNKKSMSKTSISKTES